MASNILKEVINCEVKTKDYQALAVSIKRYIEKLDRYQVFTIDNETIGDKPFKVNCRYQVAANDSVVCPVEASKDEVPSKDMN